MLPAQEIVFCAPASLATGHLPALVASLALAPSRRTTGHLPALVTSLVLGMALLDPLLAMKSGYHVFIILL